MVISILAAGDTVRTFSNKKVKCDGDDSSSSDSDDGYDDAGNDFGGNDDGGGGDDRKEKVVAGKIPHVSCQRNADPSVAHKSPHVSCQRNANPPCGMNADLPVACDMNVHTTCGGVNMPELSSMGPETNASDVHINTHDVKVKPVVNAIGDETIKSNTTSPTVNEVSHTHLYFVSDRWLIKNIINHTKPVK